MCCENFLSLAIHTEFWGPLRQMNCFHFSNGEKTASRSRKSSSTRSNSSKSTDRERRRSEFDSTSSLDTSVLSGGSSRFPSLSHRPNSLRVFTFRELKIATRNFSRSLMIGEGGFGFVYRGAIQSPKDPLVSLDVAIKQLNRGGHQVSYLHVDVVIRSLLLDRKLCFSVPSEELYIFQYGLSWYGI